METRLALEAGRAVDECQIWGLVECTRSYRAGILFSQRATVHCVRSDRAPGVTAEKCKHSDCRHWRPVIDCPPDMWFRRNGAFEYTVSVQKLLSNWIELLQVCSHCNWFSCREYSTTRKYNRFYLPKWCIVYWFSNKLNELCGSFYDLYWNLP